MKTATHPSIPTESKKAMDSSGINKNSIMPLFLAIRGVWRVIDLGVFHRKKQIANKGCNTVAGLNLKLKRIFFLYKITVTLLMTFILCVAFSRHV